MRRFLVFLGLLLVVLSFSAVYVEDGKVVITAPFPKDKVVYLAGQFNNWNPTAWPMTWDDEKGVWIYKFELKPGTYQYKFVIGGTTWKEDPEAPGYTDDGFGGLNGVFTLKEVDGKLVILKSEGPKFSKGLVVNFEREETIYFDEDGYLVLRFYAPDARYVTIAGSFNNWDANSIELYPAEDGWWEAYLENLKPGIFEYKFVVNGKDWTTDPNALAFVDDGFGGKNGVFYVYKESGKFKVGLPEGVLLGEKGVLFIYKEEGAEKVNLAGSFNGWNPNALEMKRVGQYWVVQVELKEGTYEYKYVITTKGSTVWKEDPNAPEYKPDGFGGKNGVFAVKVVNGKLVVDKP